MAQYDLIFIKNTSESGVSYTEQSVTKPSGSGFALTQDPVTGILSWKQAVVFLGDMPYQANADNYIYNGYYIVNAADAVQNLPVSGINGLLQVMDTKSIRIQIFYSEMPQSNTGYYAFIRKKIGSGAWSSWKGMHVPEGGYAKAQASTINPGDWVLDSPTGLYKASKVITSIASGDAVDVIPENSSIAAVQEAEILPNVTVSTATYTVWAKRPATSAIAVNVRIIKN